MNKRALEYQKLIEDARNYYTSYTAKNNEISLAWCDDCKEINLWTYWQGRNCIVNGNPVKIMVVGQDWGNPELNEQVMANIKSINKGKKNVFYLKEVKMFPTDEALIKIFDKVLGLNIAQECEGLFFTNLCLGYRSGKQSGGMKHKQLADGKNLELFVRLVDIVEPDVIVPLGQITYKTVCQSLGIIRPRIRKYNDLLDRQNIYGLDLKYEGDGFTSKVIPMAHPGTFGQINRSGKSLKGMDQILKDWETVK